MPLPDFSSCGAHVGSSGSCMRMKAIARVEAHNLHATDGRRCPEYVGMVPQILSPRTRRPCLPEGLVRPHPLAPPHQPNHLLHRGETTWSANRTPRAPLCFLGTLGRSEHRPVGTRPRRTDGPRTGDGATTGPDGRQRHAGWVIDQAVGHRTAHGHGSGALFGR